MEFAEETGSILNEVRLRPRFPHEVHQPDRFPATMKSWNRCTFVSDSDFGFGCLWVYIW